MPRGLALSRALRRQPVTNRTTEVPVPWEARCGFATAGQAIAKTPIAESSLRQAVNLGIGSLCDPAAGVMKVRLCCGGWCDCLSHISDCESDRNCKNRRN